MFQSSFTFIIENFLLLGCTILGGSYTAVAKGVIIICNKEEQKQDINELSCDTWHVNNELKHIFNQEKEQEIIDQM
ncbi:hypothetical protein [Gilliamella sp. Pas-s95]|uniref:hypothetical protein n=1 Tax=Gilliamella sp. Pas-s95 TaxID=2687317 RepID=UPI001325BAD6|nr:hypothetical protein [Gilliamella sp. Pas-s95]MWN06256.1 hypothetical protein [Gilliamella sp. Pas-s95]